MPSDDLVDAPITLTGLFATDSDDDEDQCYVPVYEIQTLELAGMTLRIRQFDHHSHNANRVWPGTFNLCEYLIQEDQPHLGKVLELGTATGLLAIRLAHCSAAHTLPPCSNQKQPLCHSITTSDVMDENDEIADNLAFNYELNKIAAPPLHVPHTWGSGWASSVEQLRQDKQLAANALPDSFDTILASDILLYVSAYPALVQTLEELIKPNTRFIMSWNRRMKESDEFFERMRQAGFQSQHLGRCVFEFKRRCT